MTPASRRPGTAAHEFAQRKNISSHSSTLLHTLLTQEMSEATGCCQGHRAIRRAWFS